MINYILNTNLSFWQNTKWNCLEVAKYDQDLKEKDKI